MDRGVVYIYHPYFISAMDSAVKRPRSDAESCGRVPNQPPEQRPRIHAPESDGALRQILTNTIYAYLTQGGDEEIPLDLIHAVHKQLNASQGTCDEEGLHNVSLGRLSSSLRTRSSSPGESRCGGPCVPCGRAPIAYEDAPEGVLVRARVKLKCHVLLFTIFACIMPSDAHAHQHSSMSSSSVAEPP